ncbi:MAG: hypothetical protein P8X94_03865 [Woeseiaceae bacterium]
MHSFRDSPGLLFVALALAACRNEPAPVPQPEASPESPQETAGSTCGEAGHLALWLTGALQTSIDLRDEALRCESMPRPDDRGVRMRFSADVSGERLVVIVAMPDLDPGTTGSDFDAIVTVTVENSGRFFSTPNLGACWADITRNDSLPAAPGRYIVAGEMSCVGPLGEFNGDAFVEVRELQFSGIADWRET